SGVNAVVEGLRRAELHAADASFTFGEQNQARSGRLGGGVRWETSGATASRGSAGRIILAFSRDNQIKSAQLRDNVDRVQLPGTQTGKQAAIPRTNVALNMVSQAGVPHQAAQEQQVMEQPQGTEFHGDGLDLDVVNGSQLQSATSVGAAQIALTNP